jgi:hypothetical protein
VGWTGIGSSPGFSLAKANLTKKFREDKSTYCQVAKIAFGNLSEASRRLGISRNTLKARRLCGQGGRGAAMYRDNAADAGYFAAALLRLLQHREAMQQNAAEWRYRIKTCCDTSLLHGKWTMADAKCRLFAAIYLNYASK